MRKIITVLMALSLALLPGCGSSEPTTTATTQATTKATTTETTTTEEPTTEVASENKYDQLIKGLSEGNIPDYLEGTVVDCVIVEIGTKPQIAITSKAGVYFPTACSIMSEIVAKSDYYNGSELTIRCELDSGEVIEWATTDYEKGVLRSTVGKPVFDLTPDDVANALLGTEESTEQSTEGSSVSTGEKNALESALSYLEYSGFSAEGLKDQLEFEKFTSDEAQYAVDHCGADWNAEALESAKSYLEYSGFSEKGLKDQLLFEKFTEEEASYGVEHCGADWMKEAEESAKSYMDYSSFSRGGLIDQLIFEGYTQEQAEHGADSVGL